MIPLHYRPSTRTTQRTKKKTKTMKSRAQAAMKMKIKSTTLKPLKKDEFSKHSKTLTMKLTRNSLKMKRKFPTLCSQPKKFWLSHQTLKNSCQNPSLISSTLRVHSKCQVSVRILTLIELTTYSIPKSRNHRRSKTTI